MAKVIEKSRLTLIKRVSGGSNPRGLYRCECGIIKEIRISSVVALKVRSCGCLQKELLKLNSPRTHCLSRHPIYRVWNSMKDRCYREKCESYADYGGRGVIVCAEWKDDFKAFYDWAIANGWQKGLQIDKDLKAKEMNLPPPLIYSPEWCRFVTPADNSNGRRSNRIIEYKGEKKTIKEWSRIFKLHFSTFWGRLERSNWILDDFITRPANIKKNGEPRKT